MSDSVPLLALTAVSMTYQGPGGATHVLKAVDLEVHKGESVAIVGPSGCGKSTLLNLIGGLDRPTAGTVRFEGQDVTHLDNKAMATYRNQSIGFIFQLHHLLPQCTALENVLVPTLVNPNASDAKERAIKLLDRVGLADRRDYRPGLLSGGERQRVAVVRALINKPRLLLADEPTGSLSPEGADALAQLLLDLNQEQHMALTVVTHSLEVANRMSKVYKLDGGTLVPHSGVT